MRPILFEISSYPIPSWHFFFCLAVVFAFICFKKLCLVFELCSARSHIPALLFVSFYASGWAGARLFGEFSGVQELTEADFDPLGKMSFYGGVLGGLTCCFAFSRTKLLRNFLGMRLVDAAVPSLILGLAIGRLGCLLNGDDYGTVADGLPGRGRVLQTLGWFFPPVYGSGPGNFARHSTQLQESAFSFMLVGCAAFSVALKRLQVPFFGRLPAGAIGLVLGALSCLNRFVNEFFRADGRGVGLVTDFSLPQEVSLILFFVSFVGCVGLFLQQSKAMGLQVQSNGSGSGHVSKT